MDDHWLGKQIDGAFAEEMEKRGIDVCGEYGEYHTLVVDGPIFNRRIEIKETKITRRGNMAFLHVSGFTLGQKG
jgi:diphthine-ammonia ligase